MLAPLGCHRCLCNSLGVKLYYFCDGYHAVPWEILGSPAKGLTFSELH